MNRRLISIMFLLLFKVNLLFAVSESGFSKEFASIKSGQTITIKTLIEHLNDMEKPVSIPDFLKTLPRPFKLTASTSIYSLQPSDGPDSPRFFLFFGSLIMALVPTGPGSNSIELAFQVSETQSVKGEINFPVISDLASDDPYKEILSNLPTVSYCSGCHKNEQAMGRLSSLPPTALRSDILAPAPDTVLTTESLKKLRENCLGSDSIRCSVIKELLQPGWTLARFPPKASFLSF